MGQRVVQIAKDLVGSHYINGAYGATPGNKDGTPCRKGGIQLIASTHRLDPAKHIEKTEDLAVLAAQMYVKRHCVCGGNFNSFKRSRPASPADRDLTDYLKGLKSQPPATWPNFCVDYTPRRVYGPKPHSDFGGVLVWGQSCKGIRHFDCIGFISFCLWKATGKVIQLEISQWRTRGQPMAGSKVYDLRTNQFPEKLMAADILIKEDHHIAWVDEDATIIQAADTDIGVTASSKFSRDDKTSGWTHLVRLPL